MLSSFVKERNEGHIFSDFYQLASIMNLYHCPYTLRPLEHRNSEKTTFPAFVFGTSKMEVPQIERSIVTEYRRLSYLRYRTQ